MLGNPGFAAVFVWPLLLELGRIMPGLTLQSSFMLCCFWLCCSIAALVVVIVVAGGGDLVLVVGVVLAVVVAVVVVDRFVIVVDTIDVVVVFIVVMVVVAAVVVVMLPFYLFAFLLSRFGNKLDLGLWGSPSLATEIGQCTRAVASARGGMLFPF